MYSQPPRATGTRVLAIKSILSGSDRLPAVMLALSRAQKARQPSDWTSSCNIGYDTHHLPPLVVKIPLSVVPVVQQRRGVVFLLRSEQP